MRFLRQSMIGLFLASVALGLLVYAVHLVSSAVQDRMTSERPTPPTRERVFVVNVITAQPGVETPVLETFGEVTSRRTLELRAAVAGRIIELAPFFEDGGAVVAGEVLVSIDPADLQSEFDRLTADLEDAEAEVRDADRGLELAHQEERAARQQAVLREQALARQVDLADRGVGATASVEIAELEAAAAQSVVLARMQAVTQAEARIDQAVTRLARARIALADAARDLEDATVEAPFDGTLSDTAVVEGGLIAANERLADLVDPTDLEVAFRVSTAQYARLLDDTGSILLAPVEATLDVTGADLMAQGTISRVNAAAGEGQTGRLVFARLERAPGFRPGDFVTVRVEEPRVENVVRLPASALAASGHVLALTGDDRLETLAVQLVRRQGDDVLVRGESLEGREVVRELSPLLGAGIKVRAVRESVAEAVAMPSLLELSDERRARLMAFVQGDTGMPEDDRARMLAQLAEPSVPAQMVASIESRMGG
ncbi:efflux RND transporter periplasmic adaptor subunit [Roseobacter weihaiensis]|uniref:efflux RND transporter periplasmic adaptor subunit n=1 Tax=Roseobacter weihaiensis TaxID=2763262 RepID=UPI001D0A285E|nr:HlyD family efflux transporter periplasmic adaptor subunit [Roseobacter sp. H9]